jgi:membrane associated rhomboid family serine protease
LSYGWKDARKIKNQYQIWRLITPTFLHGNAYHIIANVVSQLFLGSGIEYGLGLTKFVVLYFVTGFGGMLLSAIMKPESFAIGASTSVFGLVGFYISYLFTNWSFMGREKPG